MIMKDIYFIILNYNLHEETMACVESIKNHIDTTDYRIIIVDNASLNGSGELLQQRYMADYDVEVILLPENIGFARGNNVGISQARKEGARFVCCINDDAELISDNFYTVINEKYQRYKPALIGPKVIKPDNNVDQFYHPLKSINEYEKSLLLWQTETYKQYKKRKNYTLKRQLRRIVDEHRISRKIYQYLKIKLQGFDPYALRLPKYTEDTMDLVMKGCCLVFTPLFFDDLEGFNEATFLYYEEEFLQASLVIHDLHSLYVPEIAVFHKGGVSTNSVTGKKAVEKWRFMKKYFIESQLLFIDFLKANEKEIYHNGRNV